MQLLNRYFFPFAAFLILSAVYLTRPEPHIVYWSVGILVFSVLVNHWFVKNSYRMVRWTRFLRLIQVGLNLLWSVPLVYLLGGFWAPVWLLMLTAPATAALYLSRSQAFATALVSSLTLLGLYYLRGLEGAIAWGQALTHGLFILIFTLFIHALGQVALRLRG